MAQPFEQNNTTGKKPSNTEKFCQQFWGQMKKTKTPEAQIFQPGKTPREIRIDNAINENPQLRQTFNLAKLPIAVHKIRAKDERTNQIREGTRQLKNGKIGYFTKAGEYIPIGALSQAFNPTRIEIVEVWSTNDPRLKEQIRLENTYKKQNSNTRKKLFALNRETKKESTINLPADPSRRARFTPDKTMKLRGAYIRKPKMALPLKETTKTMEKRKKPPEMIVIHDTDSKWTLAQAVAFFKTAKVQTHYIIDKKGNLAQVVPDNQIAHHTKGTSKHSAGINGYINGKSIGIDLIKDDDDAYTDAQYRTLSKLVAHLMTRYPSIKAENVIGHRVLDKGIRGDPASIFNWKWLQKATKKEIAYGPKEKIRMPQMKKLQKREIAEK